jgi:hypothetical protein
MFGIDGKSNPYFQIVTFDTSILSNYYAAKSASFAASYTTPIKHSKQGPAVITPWKDDDLAAAGLIKKKKIDLLATRFNKLRGKTDFIDSTTKAVKAAGSNLDDKALFTLYSALRDLETIAEYAASDKTPEALLAKVHSQFKAGLSQVRDFIKDAKLDKLILLYGEKKARVESAVQLGKNIREIEGRTLNVISKTSTLSGVTSADSFTINIKAGTDKDNIVIDLSGISGPITLESLVNHINSQISSLTKVDGDGNTVSKYETRAQINDDGNKNFSLGFKVESGSILSFSSAAAEPALVIAGNFTKTGLNQTKTGQLTKIDGLSSAAVKVFSQTVAGYELEGNVPVLKDKDGKKIPPEAPKAFETNASGVASDSQGNIYVVGSSKGHFGSQINTASEKDVYLSKYNASGEIVWQRLLGASDTAEAFDIKVDGNDNIIIAGRVNGELKSSDVQTGFDSFVTKYDSGGIEQWTHQLDSASEDQANALAVDASGNIYIAGQVRGRISSAVTGNGGTDSFVVKLDGTNGATLGQAQFGTSGEEFGEGITIAGDGSIILASREGGDAIIRKLDAADLSNVLSTINLGSLSGGKITDLEANGSNIYIAGTANAALSSGGTVVSGHNGSRDGFITSIDASGALSASWTNYIGTSSADEISGLTVRGGSVYAVGQTYAQIGADIKRGARDGFAVKLDGASGTQEWTHQFGASGGYTEGAAVTFTSAGSSVLTKLGLPTGKVSTVQTRDILTQTSARVGDHFFISIDGGRKHKIDIRKNDTFHTLSKRIDRLHFRNIKSSATLDSKNGSGLKIEAKSGSTIEIIAGKGMQDLLAKIGLEPTKILPSKVLFSSKADKIGTDPDHLGGVFAFNLNRGFGLRNHQEAEYVKNQIKTAIDHVKRAHRSLTYDPIKAEILRNSKIKKGNVSPYLLKQLTNYQDGLAKLTGGAGISI